jgi:hypothetical protein
MHRPAFRRRSLAPGPPAFTRAMVDFAMSDYLALLESGRAS